MADRTRRKMLQTVALLPIGQFVGGAARAESPSGSVAGPFKVAANDSRSGAPLQIFGEPFALTKISSADVSARYAAIVLNTPPGHGPEMHIHLKQNEWFFLLSGKIGLQCDNQRFVLTAGDSFLAPAGTPHSYVSLGTSAARILNLFDPAGDIEKFFAAYAPVIDGMPAGAAKNARLASLYEAHGMRVVGPPLRSVDFDE